MLQNPTLFRAFDRDWTLQNVAFALSLACLLIAGTALTYLLIRNGQTRALTEKEMETLGRTPDGNPVRMQWAGGKGVRIETSISIDGMRRAAKRGDWALFWAWSALFVSGGGFFGLLIVGMALLDPKDGMFILCLGAGSGLLFVLFGLFLPWAALYTNIDLGADGPEP